MFRFAQLALVAVFTVAVLLSATSNVIAYSAGDPIYINTTASSYCAASGNNFTVTVTLTDFAGNGVTGQSNLLDLKTIEDVNKSGPNTSFNTGTGQFTDNGDGTYSVSGNITANGNDPYYIEVEWTDGNNYKMKSSVTLNIDTFCSSNIPARLDSAPDYTYYPTSGTVVAKFRLLAQDGSPYTGATLETGNAGNGGQDTLYINKVESINKDKMTWTVSSATDNGDGTYDFIIDYSGGVETIWPVEARYEYDSNGNVRLSGSFAFEINSAQTSGGNPTGTPPTNPGAPELTTPPCAATTPSNLAAPTFTSTQVDLTWTYDGTNNNYYTVFRGGVQIATNITTGSYSDTTALAGTSYAYTVRGYNNTDTCESADSNTANVTTPTCVSTGSLAITASQTLNGNPISLANITTLTNSSGEVFTASVGTAGGPAIDEQEYFDGNDTNNDWSVWTDTPSNPGTNGFLVTYNSGTGTNTCAGGVSGTSYSPSADTGPCAFDSGTGFIYLENSGSPAYADSIFARNASFDADANELNISFSSNLNTTAGEGAALRLEANDGSGWVTEWQQIDDDGNGGAWTPVTLDLFNGGGLSAKVYNTGTVDLRFVFVSGSTWANDVALDTIRVFGPGRGTLTTLFTGNLTQAATVDTTGWTNGSIVTLDLTGNDATCGTALPAAQDTFTWNSCSNTNTLSLTPIIDPITGAVSVVASGTAPNITVGTSPAAGNASGWTYNPAQDDNTTVVSFYAVGDSSCGGTFSVSQLNVATNTMAAPTVTAFSVPANVIDTAAPLDVPISSFTATDNVAVTGYMVTETATVPLAGAAGWSGTAPATYTVAGYGSYTLYAWAKDAAGNVSLSSSAPVTMSNCTPTITALNISVSTNPINYPTTSSVITVVPTGGTVTGAEWSANGGTSWFASGATYTVPVQASGSVNITGRATEDTCSTLIAATNEPVAVNFDTRSPGIEAGNATAVQTAIDTISVTMPYLGDVNGDATFQVDYKLASSGTWTNGTPSLDSGGSPYSQNISGLTSPETYDVRMTYADVDGVISGTATQQVVVVMAAWADNAMLHNSLRFAGTTKHGGNWGTPGNYAGGITCSTCHAKNTGNVKRIKATISFPDGSAMPGGGTSAAVNLLTVEDGTSDFGDDSTAPRASSNKVCEACHTADLTQANGTKQHAADQAAVSGHYDNADCIKCHQHSAGFKADCTTCHGNPPTANTLGGPNGLSNTPVTGSATSGKHSLHAVTKAYACNTCHTGWETGGQMPNAGNINVGFSAFGDTTATYDGRAAGAYTTQAGTTVTTTGGLTCSAIYCHGTSVPKWLDTEPAMACGSCHGSATDGGPIETAGDGDLAGNTTGRKVGKHVKHIPVSQSETGTACGLCHLGAGDGTALHVNGTNNIIFDTTKAGASATYTSGTSTCSNLSCHSTQVWDTASAALACDSCHGYPPTSSADAVNNKHVGVTAVNHDKSVAGSTTAITSNHQECNTCHGKSQTNGLTDNTASGGDAYLASYHRDGNIEMNGISTPNNSQSAEYDQTTFGCAKACHANDAPHQLSDSGLTVQLHEYGAGDCNGCHDAGTGGAPVINASSSHVDADGAGGTYTAATCTDCHPGGTKGAMHSKNGDANVAVIANNATVGINYSHVVDGATSGFVLGGDATSGTTEAEICWNCHNGQTPKISEWGTNTETNTGSSPYDYGNLTGGNSNWIVGATAAEWNSANFTYKKGNIQSTHSVNSAGVQGVDAVANIRCSYCHDVHNTAGSTLPTAALKAADVSGVPYLRGSWKGNPYREDGAPLSGNTYASQGTHGNVPRGGSGATEMGGYQIDLNNGNPTNGWSPSGSAGFAGVCILCHEGTSGTAQDGVWQVSEINSLNQFGTASTDWVGNNGHANAVLGGDGTGASNIFSTNDRNLNAPTFGTSKGQSAGNPAMAYQQNTSTGSEEYGWRNNSSRSGEGWDITPLTTAIRAYESQNYTWGATVTNGTTPDIGYHKFSCSKCHNPHASRLPRLMITNCLDTKHNTWDTGTGIQLIPATTVKNGNGASPDVSSASMPLSQATSAQNCHRVRDPAYTNSRGAGWNNVTPW